MNDLSTGNPTSAPRRSATQVKTASEISPVRRPPQPPTDFDPEEGGSQSMAPRQLPSHDGPIGSSVARNATPIRQARSQPEFAPQPSVPAPSLSGYEESQFAANQQQSEMGQRQTVQYVWVPANQAQAMGNPNSQAPLAFAPARAANYQHASAEGSTGQPLAINPAVPGVGIAPARFDHPQMPQYAWPSYAPYPNYGAVTYPKQYSPMAWPYIGPFYPYPQVPLGWRKVTLEWDDGWWQLDFKSRH